MGWLSSWKWRTPTILRKDYASNINPEFTTVVGWSGGWLKCIDKKTDRPYLICVLVRRFSKGEYGYKDMESSMGPYYYNMAAVKWLKRELAKRNMAPYNSWEASLILRHDRKARHDATLKAMTPGTELVARTDFSCTNGAEFKPGDKFILEYVSHGKFHVRTTSGMRYRLSQGCFVEPVQMDDYPLVAV